MRVQLSQETVARLMRPVRGRGGFQSLLRKLQPRISGQILEIDATDYERLNRYSRSYGRGGFQGRTSSAASDAQSSLDFGG